MILPEINIPQPKIKLVDLPRAELPIQYQGLLIRNPALLRIESTCKSIGWTDIEIRTAQLITAVASNASLQQKLKDCIL